MIVFQAVGGWPGGEQEAPVFSGNIQTAGCRANEDERPLSARGKPENRPPRTRRLEHRNTAACSQTYSKSETSFQKHNAPKKGSRRTGNTPVGEPNDGNLSYWHEDVAATGNSDHSVAIRPTQPIILLTPRTNLNGEAKRREWSPARIATCRAMAQSQADERTRRSREIPETLLSAHPKAQAAPCKP